MEASGGELFVAGSAALSCDTGWTLEAAGVAAAVLAGGSQLPPLLSALAFGTICPLVEPAGWDAAGTGVELGMAGVAV